MLRDGERCLGSHEVVAGVMAMSAHLTQDAGRAYTGREMGQHGKLQRFVWILVKLLKEHKASHTQSTKLWRQNIFFISKQCGGFWEWALPAFVRPFRGEFVATAAVWGVAKRPVWGGGACSGPQGTATSPADSTSPTDSTSPNSPIRSIRTFMGTTLARKVGAHPFHDLFHYLILKLKKKWVSCAAYIHCLSWYYCITSNLVKIIKPYFLHVWSEPHRRGLIFWFVALAVFYSDLY